jgi:hypothetical protein
MGDDAEQDGPAGCKHYRVVTRQLLVGDKDCEDDSGQAKGLPIAPEIGADHGPAGPLRGTRFCDPMRKTK